MIKKVLNMENKEKSLKTENNEAQKTKEKIKKLIPAIAALAATQGKNVLINADPNADSLEPKNVKKYPAPKKDKRKVFYSW